jgi:type I restriction enzyme R subunit
MVAYQKVTPNPQRLIEEQVRDDYIVLTQRPSYASEAAWRNEAERPVYIQTNKLRFLRRYQLRAIHALQRAVKDGRDRFLFEMVLVQARH